jgi:hypothetical protein
VRHPKDVGDRSTLAIMAALQACGYAVLMPFGENTRYDLVIDSGARLIARAVQDRAPPQRERHLQHL